MKKDGKESTYFVGRPHKQKPITDIGYKIEGDNIICPFHLVVFSLITGELIKPPESKTPCSPNCKLIRAKLINGEVLFDKPFIPKTKG
jgi:nitrite reductase/ring-hydroxylating ferredoxin subunit